MTVKKVLNNNCILTIGKGGAELIIFGKAIGYQKRKGDTVELDKITKIFSAKSLQLDQMQELLKSIPQQYLLITTKILDIAKAEYHLKIRDKVYFMLADHIYFAVERHEQNISLPAIFQRDIVSFCPKEYAIGCEALKIIKDETGIELPENEASFIAIHLIENQEGDNLIADRKTIIVMDEILKIIAQHFPAINNRTIQYQRFMTHLKFFSKRIASGEILEDSTLPGIRFDKESVLVDAALNEVEKTIHKQYKAVMTGSERTYLKIHLVRLISL